MAIYSLQNPSATSSTVVITLSGSTVFQAGAVVFTNVASLGTCATQTHKGGDAVSSTSVSVAAPGTGEWYLTPSQLNRLSVSPA